MAQAATTYPYIWILAPLYSWRVAAGARLMDAKKPGWHNRIDKERLDFFSDCNCIIGQVCGSFYRDRERIIGHKLAVQHALFVVGNGFSPGWITLFSGYLRRLFVDRDPSSPRRLRIAWVYQVDKRLAADRARFAVENGA